MDYERVQMELTDAFDALAGPDSEDLDQDQKDAEAIVQMAWIGLRALVDIARSLDGIASGQET